MTNPTTSRRTFLGCTCAALAALTLPIRTRAARKRHTPRLDTATTLLTRLQSYSTGDTPFLPAYDAAYAIAHHSAVTSCTDPALSAAIAALQSELSGLRNCGFTVTTSPSSVIAEPIVISGVPSDPPSSE